LAMLRQKIKEKKQLGDGGGRAPQTRGYYGGPCMKEFCKHG